MSYRGDRSSGTNVYVGNLPPDVRSRDLERVFDTYGHIANVDLKTGRGPPFAFVEFEDPRDADDAVRDRDRLSMDGYRLKVEFPRGGFGRGRGRGSFRGGRGPPRPRRSQYRVEVLDLPPTGSWQDLKDHMREAGDVLYTDVNRNCTGTVEFEKAEAMRYAVRKLDGTKFRSHEGEETYIKVREASDNGYSGRRNDRSRSRERSRRTPSYSPKRRHSRSRSSS